MNKSLFAAAVLFVACGSTLAQGLTRQQVVDELIRARSTGELAMLNSENPTAYGVAQPGAKPVTREQVVAELDAARASGELFASNREGYEPKTTTHSTLTRAEVIAEYQRARASGELAMYNSENSGHLPPAPHHQAQGNGQLATASLARRQ